MFAALGSCASIQYIQDKASACVEILRKVAHDMSSWTGSRDLNRRHNEVSIRADVAALCLDLAVQRVHTFSKRMVSLPSTGTKHKKNQGKKICAVKDVLWEGRRKLVEYGMFEDWKKRTMAAGLHEGPELYNEEGDEDMVFSDPSGQLTVDTAMDPDFVECPFSNADIDSQ
jgi:hypothetical protein